jgi:hypothetical protein
VSRLEAGQLLAMSEIIGHYVAQEGDAEKVGDKGSGNVWRLVRPLGDWEENIVMLGT